MEGMLIRACSLSLGISATRDLPSMMGGASLGSGLGQGTQSLLYSQSDLLMD